MISRLVGSDDPPTARVRRSVPVRANTQYAVEFTALGRLFAAHGRTARTRPELVLRDISLTIRAGEVVAILGLSGCGKSTLLRITAGLDSPSFGSVRIDGSETRGIDPRCSFVFQEPRLLPWRTLAGNVTLGLPDGRDHDASRADGHHRSDGDRAGRGDHAAQRDRPDRDRVAELLALVGLTAYADHRPREVSGGMAQRTALARALARDPGVLLLDEPFGALDALTRLRMQDLLLDIHAAAPTTVLLVTHDVDEAVQMADRVVLLGEEAGRPGSTIREVLTVPGSRPRDRGSAELAALRATLLGGLGIEAHRH